MRRSRTFFLAALVLFLGSTTSVLAQTGTEVWDFTTAYLIEASPAVGTDGTIYVPSYENIYAMTPGGSNKWVSDVNNYPGIFGSPAIGPDGTIYFGGSADGVLYALDPATGTNKWTYSISANDHNNNSVFYTSAAIGPDGAIYIGSYKVQNNDTPYLYAFNANGTLRWRYAPPGPIYSSASISQDGATVYFGCDDGKLYALSTNGTTLRWAFNTGPQAITASPAIDAGGKIYLGVGSVLNPKFYCVNTNGTTNWVFNCTNRIQSSAAIGDDGTVYFGSDDMHLYALNTNGTLRWAAFTGATNGSSPAIAADGTLYIGSENGNLYAFNGNGSNLWAFSTGGAIFSSPAIGTNGTVYVGSEDTKMYALNGTSGLARTPWPKFGRDLRHTAKYVAITNTQPAISAIGDQTNNPNTTLGPLTLTVSDAETPAGNLMVSGVSSNPSLVPNFGLLFGGAGSNRFLNVSPATNQSGTTLITLTVTDAAGATNSTSFLLTVNSVNHAPQFVQTLNQTNYVLTVIMITNMATDSDLPPQTLTFTLIAAPTNATINSASGVFTWTPTGAEGPSTNLIRVSVTDSGVTPLSATNTFSIVVVPPPNIQSPVSVSDGFVITWNSIPQFNYRVQFKTNLDDTLWIDLSNDVLATGYTSARTNFAMAGTQRFYRVMVLP